MQFEGFSFSCDLQGMCFGGISDRPDEGRELMESALIETIVSDSMLATGMPVELVKARGGFARPVKQEMRTPCINPAWTREERAFVQSSLGRIPIKEISRALGRSEIAIKVLWTRKGYTAPSKITGYMTAHQVGMLMGLDSHTVPAWIRYGIMPGEFVPTRERTILRVSIVELKKWLIKPEHWPYFKVERIKNRHYRRLVELAQERWNDEWLCMADAAKLALPDIKHGTKLMQPSIYRGKLPAIQCPHIGGRDKANWSFWFVRRSDVLKWRQPKGTDLRIPWATQRACETLLRLSAEGKNSVEIGRMSKRNPKTICYLIHKLKKRASGCQMSVSWKVPEGVCEEVSKVKRG
jgi:hypothetical protein